MRSRFLDIAIFHREVRCVEKSRWEMAETQSWRGFDGFIFMWKKHLFLS